MSWCAKADVTLADPVGLYIAGLSTVGWSTPDGSNPLDYWKIARGNPDKALRAVYEVPQDKGFVVGDIAINGKPIDFGGQIADFLQIKVTGLACRFGKSNVPPKTQCVAGGKKVAPRLIQASPSDTLHAVPLFRNSRP